MEFWKKHKEELKQPIIYAGVGLAVLIVGFVTNQIENMTTIVFGVGPIVLAIRDLAVIVAKEKDWY